MPVRFRFADKSDQSRFTSFSCTDPVPANRQIDGRWVKGSQLHPEPWALLVQRLIHNSPIYHDKDCWIRVGVDDETGNLASYCAVAHKGNGVYEIAVIAVSRRLRGLGLGTQALRDAMAVATRDAVQRDLNPVFIATIDENNRASAHLFASFGYQLIRTYEKDRHGFVFNLWARR
ncbi:GNAT family N-acetyltransferase [Bifidobacterium reuteri]|uniref:N-acetyltransferase n=3 Tax=Bifidobacterium TaxID=1678 RepID=A0A2M9HQ88_9BIFI|nr:MULTISPECIES: GNAT family N-acetyltransferase [Bifidobacterium]KAA8818517.1 N-acetyltransferase [Bifidobacterium rousetti]KAA8823375.1 GNAT family N-acetyltransferase [Bifidobacterium reuteri]KFI50755.1 hypothetical protein BBIA_1548 [Bifidobacterium biavatii DSM 23969]PJM78987.1 N-acetyltransferase [Bifidobacterium scaligerum]